MAGPKTQFATNDPNTRKKWSKDLFKIILPGLEYSYLVGTGTDSIVQLKTELGKGEGDKITFGIRLPLTGAGVVGRDTVEGNEEKLIFKDFDMTIEELNHAVDTGGRMEEQRIPWDLMSEGKNALQDWWVDKLSDYLIATLCGDTSFKIAGKTFAQVCTAPSTNKVLRVNDTAEASITSADVMDLHFLDRMKQLAELPTGDSYKVRPLIKGGKKYFRVILHNYVFDALRQNMNVGQFGDLQKAAGKLQFANVEFEYNGMLVSKSERVTSPYDNVYRNILLGAQAATLAWGGAGESKGTVMSFVPYEKDAKRYVMIRGGGILGAKKVVFNSEDYGVITGSSYGAALT
jgi:N4-gp56 family major capsid protein